MFDLRRKAKVEVKVSDYTITLFVKDQEDSKITYIDYSDYLSSTFSIREDNNDYELVMKCEEEKIEKVLHVFDTKGEAQKAIELLASAMMAEQKTVGSRLKTLFRFTLKALAVLAVLLVFSYMFLSGSSVEDAQVEKKMSSKTFKQESIPQGRPVPLEEMLK